MGASLIQGEANALDGIETGIFLKERVGPENRGSRRGGCVGFVGRDERGAGRGAAGR